MGSEINKRTIFLLDVAILSAALLTLVLVIIFPTQDTEKKEMGGTVSVPQKTQQTSGQIAGVLEGPTVVNISTRDNSSNETK
jgi:hypothetical protein